MKGKILLSVFVAGLLVGGTKAFARLWDNRDKGKPAGLKGFVGWQECIVPVCPKT